MSKPGLYHKLVMPGLRPGHYENDRLQTGRSDSSFLTGRERCEQRGGMQTSAANTKIARKKAPRERIMNKPLTGIKRKLRSSEWFNNPHNPGMTALYLERYLNYGLTRHELQSGKPIIGIAQTGSDLSPCNRHHL